MSRVFIAFIAMFALLALVPEASAGYRDACPVSEAKERVARAYSQLELAQARLAQAKSVLADTIAYSQRYGASVGRWVWLARQSGFARGQLPTAMLVIDRESHGDPGAWNPASDASGLFQFLPAWWQGKWNPFDPRQSMVHARRAVDDVGWSPWSL